MAVIRCKMCGGDLVLVEGQSVAECEYCGSRQTVPAADNEKKLTLFARAGRLRAACEFDKAAGIYETIVADFPEEAEAYWGLLLCKYGIEYVDDPATGKKIPTCHRSSFESIMEDVDFEQALENADSTARRVYREEAKQIEQIRKGIIAVSANEQPYDIFICYKETDENGDRTLDSVLAQDIYDALTEKGYRVFFSRITLEDKLGVEYEPYIFAALNSAKIMLAVGTDYEFYNAVWVKNEWSRYLKLMTQDKNKHLIPCYKGIDAYDMPKEFAKLQAQDLGKMGAIQDILRGVEKLLPRNTEAKKETVQVQQSAEASPTQPLLRRVFLFLEDGNWSRADEYCEKILDMNPECAEAYLGKMLAELHIHRKENLVNCTTSFADNTHYIKALRFADPALKAELEQALSFVVSVMETEENSDIQNGVLRNYSGKQSRVLIPKSVRKIDAAAFADCSGLNAIEISENVEEIAPGAFSGCADLSEIRVSKKNPAFCSAGTCLIDKKQKTVIFGIRFQDVPTDGSIRGIGTRAFSGRETISEIRIPEGVISIGKEAFADCGNLKSVVLPGSIAAIGIHAFPHNPGIRIQVSADNPVFGTEGSCLINKQEKSVIFGTDIQDLPTDGSVTKIGAYAFIRCSMPESIVLPDCISSVGEKAFADCENLASVSVFSKTLTIADNAFGSATEGLTLYAFQDSEAARWAKKNRISTKENAEMKCISTAALLNRGNLALKDGDWSKAAGFFEGVLKNDSGNAQAYLGKALVQEQCHTLNGLVRKRVDVYRNVTPEKLHIRENTAHINEMTERYSIPGYLGADEIRKLYAFDLSYLSEVSGRQKQYVEASGWWKNHRQLSHAEELAEGPLAEQLRSEKQLLLAQMSDRLKKARELEAVNLARVQSAYAVHIAAADEAAERLYAEGLARREKDYQDWQEQAKLETAPDKLKKLAGEFSGLGDFKDSSALAEYCRQRAAEEQEKIDAEKKLQRAISAERKKAKRKRIAPVIAAVAVITAVCILLTGPLSQLLLNGLFPEGKYEKAQELLANGQYEDALAAFEALGDYEDAAQRVLEIRYLQAEQLLADGRYEEAIDAFEALGDYRDSQQRIADCELAKLESQGKLRQAALGYYKCGEREKSLALWDKGADRETISVGYYHTVGLRNDGTVVVAGSNWDCNKKTISPNGQCDVDTWNKIVDIEAGNYHTVGLKSDGTVLATGQNSLGQCEVSEWTDIVAVAAGEGYSAGLRADGTVMVAGSESVSSAADWTDIISIAGGDEVIIGIKADGTTVSTKPNVIASKENVTKVAIGAAYVFLHEDGSVSSPYSGFAGLDNIEDVFAGSMATLCRQKDGKLHINILGWWYGWRAEKRKEFRNWSELERTDIAAISIGEDHAVVLHADGTVAVLGENVGGRCNVQNWTDIKIPKKPEMPHTSQSENAATGLDRAAAYQEAEKLLADGKKAHAAIAFGKLGDYQYSKERSLALWREITGDGTISAGQFRTMAVQQDGKVLITDGSPIDSGMAAVSDGNWHYVGLRSNGTVDAKTTNSLMAGLDSGPLYTKNVDRPQQKNTVASWKNILAISAGDTHTVGLRTDGTVVAAGDNHYGRCKVEEWKEIQAVSAGFDHTVGLQADGTVLSIGGNKDGLPDTTQWENIVAVSAGKYFTVGLQKDGTVIAAGENEFGQCDVSDWSNIVAVSAGNAHTVALRLDGTVVAVGGNEYGQCDVSQWQDIVAIDAGGWHTVGLKADGTLVAVGHTNKGQCDVSGWKNVKLPRYAEFASLEEAPTQSPEILYAEAEALLANGETAKAAIAFGKLGDFSDARQRSMNAWSQCAVRELISTGFHTVGIRSNGTVVAVGNNTDGQCNVSGWKNIVAVSASMIDTVGLKADGTVVAVGRLLNGMGDVSDWRDIVDISVGGSYTVGLKSDGTVIAVGGCEVSDWQDIVDVSSGGNHVVGLKSDGTVVATGRNHKGQCDVSDWKNIVAVSAGGHNTVGLRADGTVVVVGDNSFNQYDASSWQDITSISVGTGTIVGLKADGTVVIAGWKKQGLDRVSDWQDIVAINAGHYQIVGLKSDGTVVAAGPNNYGQSNVSDWSDMLLPN